MRWLSRLWCALRRHPGPQEGVWLPLDNLSVFVCARCGVRVVRNLSRRPT